jgi:hypothetical protein
MASPLSEQGGKLDKEQQRVALSIIRIGRKRKLPPKDIITALITGIQESGLRNLKGGHSDSSGWRQERDMYYPSWNPQVNDDTKRFYNELAEVGPGSVGARAQAVQRSAFPSAYAPHVDEARSILKQLSKAGGAGRQKGLKRAGAKKGANLSSDIKVALKSAQPQAPKEGLKLAALDFIRNRDDPSALLQFAQTKKEYEASQLQLPDVKSLLKSGGKKGQPLDPTKLTGKNKPNKLVGNPNKLIGHPVARAKREPGLANFEGNTIAAWIKPYLVWARKKGWKGGINSGYRSEAEQRRIYASGVRPAAVPGTSNHEGKAWPRGAIDVDDAPTLARILKKYPGGSALKWAGAADPPHFSYPHNGSY